MNVGNSQIIFYVLRISITVESQTATSRSNLPPCPDPVLTHPVPVQPNPSFPRGSLPL